MNNILLMHGINLNMLGKRDKKHYGSLSLEQIVEITKTEAQKYGFNIIAYQSNYEGALVDKLQSVAEHCVGIIINPGAFTHYSYGLHDALLDTRLPIVEVHLSDVKHREKWRQNSVISPLCLKVIEGKLVQGYQEAVFVLREFLQNENK